MTQPPETGDFGDLTDEDAEAWRAFGRGVLVPDRPRLADTSRIARDVLRNFTRRGRTPSADLADALSDPGVVAEAWEAMCTRLDGGWLTGPAARSFLPFVEFRCSRYRNGEFDRSADRSSDRPVALAPTPLNVETAVALLAADAGAVRRAEELALEAARRMAPWGVPRPTRVAWTLLSTAWPTDDFFETVFDWPSDATFVVNRSALAAQERRTVSRRRGRILREVRAGVDRAAYRQRRFIARSRALDHVSRFGAAWDRWRALAERRQQVIEPVDDLYPMPRVQFGDDRPTFRHLPNALDPMMQVWGLGYALVDVRWDVVVLGAPADFAPASATSMKSLQDSQRRRYGDGLSLREQWRPGYARRPPTAPSGDPDA